MSPLSVPETGVGFGLDALLGFLELDPDISDVRWAAYMLATVKHECADRWQPIEEFGKGKDRPVRSARHVAGEDGTQYTNKYYGRGYVQLTWNLNYDKLSRALDLGNGLVLHPEHALEPQTAYRIMSYGMRRAPYGQEAPGLRARRCLRLFSGATHYQYPGQAAVIQGYGERFEDLLRQSLTANGGSPATEGPDSSTASAAG